MPAQISLAKRADLDTGAWSEGEMPNAIARRVGVSRRTVSNYRRKAREAGGIPVVPAHQVAGIPAALAFIQGNDAAIDDQLNLMDLKAQAETMRILVQARNQHQESRSVDVVVFADFLRQSANVLAVLDGPVEEWGSMMDNYMRGSQPLVVDRLKRDGLM